MEADNFKGTASWCSHFMKLNNNTQVYEQELKHLSKCPRNMNIKSIFP